MRNGEEKERNKEKRKTTNRRGGRKAWKIMRIRNRCDIRKEKYERPGKRRKGGKSVKIGGGERAREAEWESAKLET